MTFALQAMSLKYVAENGERIGDRVENVPYEIDEQVARFKLESLGISMDRLSEEQKINIWRAGHTNKVRLFIVDGENVNMGRKN